MQLENATSAINHILYHTSRTQVLENSHREQLNRTRASAGTDLVAEYSDVNDYPTPKEHLELRSARSQFDMAKGRAPNADTASEDANFSKILDHEIDEALDGDLMGASAREALALYEDIRATQRQVLRLKDEIATSNFTAPVETESKTSNTKNPFVGSPHKDAREVSMDINLGNNPRTFQPYKSSQQRRKTAPGKSLRGLRQLGIILLEDTTDTFSYLPLHVAANWEVSAPNLSFRESHRFDSNSASHIISN